MCERLNTPRNIPRFPDSHLVERLRPRWVVEELGYGKFPQVSFLIRDELLQRGPCQRLVEVLHASLCRTVDLAHDAVDLIRIVLLNRGKTASGEAGKRLVKSR